jgi:segregation and condensation protein A
MNETASDWFEEPKPAPDDEVLYVDVAGYEGPLDLLLDLARRQKVDLARISVLALAEQYLGFIETIREKRIEIAADYLVMAAWLAYLKSRLMVPSTETDDEPSGEMMAALLQFRLKRLEAMRQAASNLMNRQRLGVGVYARGLPEPTVVNRRTLWEATLYDLLKAYATQRERTIPVEYTPRERTVWSLQEARDILQRLIGDSMDWVPMDVYLTRYLGDTPELRTARASTFASSLELVRQGHVELRQTVTFGPLLMRRRKTDGPAGPGNDDGGTRNN